MKIGILSDSHGRLHALRDALGLLDREGAEVFVHCGDVGGLDAIDELAGRRCWFVWGNTDDPQPSWRKSVEESGLPWPEGPLDLSWEGRRIGVFHGHERGFAEAIDSSEYDYVLCGHTHRRNDQRVGRTRVINPGALYRVSVRTVATLDLASDSLRFIELDGAA